MLNEASAFNLSWIFTYCVFVSVFVLAWSSPLFWKEGGGGKKQQQRLRVRKLSSITAYNLNTTSAALNSLSNNFAEWFLRSRVREDGWKTGFVYSRKSYFVAWLLLVVSPLRASPLLPHWLSLWCSPTPSNLLPPLPAPRSFSIYWAGFCFGCRLLTFMSPRWYYTW